LVSWRKLYLNQKGNIMLILPQDQEDNFRAYTDAVMVWLGVGPRIASLTADYLRQQGELWTRLSAQWMSRPADWILPSVQLPLIPEAPQVLGPEHAQSTQTRRKAQAEGMHLKQGSRQRPKKREN
jgi:hypothetical protein